MNAPEARPVNKGGRPKGAKNKMSGQIKQHIEKHFYKVNKDGKALDALYAESKTAYFTLIAKLVPAEVKADVTMHAIDLGAQMKEASQRLEHMKLANVIDVTPEEPKPLINNETRDTE